MYQHDFPISYFSSDVFYKLYYLKCTKRICDIFCKLNDLIFNPSKFVQQEYALFLEQLYSFMISYTHIFLLLKNIDGLFQADSHGPNQPVKTHKWSQIPEQPSIAYDHAH